MLPSVCEWRENMQFHYLSIVGDESAPKACKLQHVCVIRGQHEARHSLKKRVCVKEEGKAAQPPLLCLSTVICISAAHHYVKVSINQSPLLFIVSPCTVARLLNKKTFLHGRRRRRRREQRGRKMQLYSLDLKMF